MGQLKPKSALVQVNGSESNDDLDDAVEFLGYATSQFPTIYIELPLSAESGKNELWEALIHKVLGRLVSWKSNVLSKA